jgi:cellulose synthase/poly-beta-1,6-N-acetylglucosamine synthase-like glycosyltransferase
MFARGELVTDAEDIPQPMQLRPLSAAFQSAPADVACLQARLSYYNSNENWLTRSVHH